MDYKNAPATARSSSYSGKPLPINIDHSRGATRGNVHSDDRVIVSHPQNCAPPSPCAADKSVCLLLLAAAHRCALHCLPHVPRNHFYSVAAACALIQKRTLAALL